MFDIIDIQKTSPEPSRDIPVVPVTLPIINKAEISAADVTGFDRSLKALLNKYQPIHDTVLK